MSYDLSAMGYKEYVIPTGVRVITGTGKNTQYFNTPDVYDVAGDYLPEGNEYVCIGHTTVADSNGITYIQFKYNDTNNYWMADISDRVETYRLDNFSEDGIDVSDYQGVIDWAKVAAAGKKFAILKAVSTKNSQLYIQTYWESNYAACKENGIKVGAYLYTYAVSDKKMQDELSYMLTALQGKTFEYPIFVDVEDPFLYQNSTKEELTTRVKWLCAQLKANGYRPGIYTSTNFANTHLNMAELAEYDFWVADWTGSVTYSGDYTMWQYSSKGAVDGIEGNVDLDISYVDYANITNKSEEEGEMATKTVIKTVIQFRRDTTANWLTNKDVVPAAGEPCFDLNLHTLKIGDGTTTYENLPAIGGVDVSADGKSIVLSDGVFKLAGFDAAEVGAQPKKNADGELEWVVPSSKTLEGLQTIVAGLQTDVATLQTNVSAIQEILTPSAEGEEPLLTRVQSLEEKMDGTGEGSVDKKIDAKINKFATEISDNGTIDTFKELVDYVANHGGEISTIVADIADLQSAVEGKVDQEAGKSLVSDTLIAKLEAINEGAQVNVIESVSVGGTLLDIVEKGVNIPVATDTALGVVKASEEVTVGADGTLGIGTINVSKLVSDGTELVLDGGAAF